MSGVDRRERWVNETCAVCPAQQLGAGQFDVSDRPGPSSRYDRDLDYRVDVDTGAPVCVHPYRVGLPVGAYASAGVAIPADIDTPLVPAAHALELPDQVTDLEGWIVAVIRAAGPHRIHAAVAAAEQVAAQRFAERDVVAAMRRVLGVELARV